MAAEAPPPLTTLDFERVRAMLVSRCGEEITVNLNGIRFRLSFSQAQMLVRGIAQAIAR